MSAIVLILYYSTLGVLAVFGGHRLVLLVLYYRTRHRTPPHPRDPSEWPVVTVQLPLYNEYNVAERAIRPVAIGRKNWLFVGSIKGGQATAVLLSLVQTCRGLGINPREYLEDVMRRIMGHPANRLAELLPDQWAAERKKNGADSKASKPLHVR